MKQLRDSVVKWLVFSLLCLLFGFLLGKFKLEVLMDKLAVMTQNLQQMEAGNATLEIKQSRLDVIAISNQKTIKSLLQSNKQLQEDLAVVNNKLYFYEGVLAPENEATGLKIHSFEIAQNKEKGVWDYELVLMQSQKGRRLLNGQFNIVFAVFEEQSLKEITLPDLNEDGSAYFKFKYFQTIQGSFSLPNGVSVDEVILKLAVEGNRWYKAQNVEARYDWRVLSTKDTGELSEFGLDAR